MNTSFNNRGGRSRGFTLLEIAVSLAVIGFAIVAVIGVLPMGLNIQKDTRERTVILQDATYFMEAIRHGAAEVITNRVASTALLDSIPSMWQVYQGLPPVLLARNVDYKTDAEIIERLSAPSREVPGIGRLLYTVALVRSLSGAASEKGGSAFDNRIAFSYFLRSEILSITNTVPIETHITFEPLGNTEFNLRTNEWGSFGQNLSDLRFAVMWPPVPDVYDAQESYRNKQVFRTLVSGFVGRLETRNDADGKEIYTIQPRRFGL